MENVFPKEVFTVFGIPIRDTVISTWAMIIIVWVMILIIRRRKPTALEMLFEFLNDMVTDIMRRPAGPYMPLLGALAIFITVADIIGVVPFLVSPTKDINTTLALATVVFFSVHFYGIRAKGFVRYFKDLASPIFILPLEVIGQLTRTVSLTLRLFGNILSTEMIVAIIFVLAPLLAPLPLMGFSLFTGVLQAYIFTALAAVYITTGLEINTPTKPEINDESDIKRS
jgi:F-type H+-transporting ATPase subunit a